MKSTFDPPDSIPNLPFLALSSSEVWCILGGNASGKSQLARVIEQRLKKTHTVAFLSFETLQAEHERELANDDTDFLDRIDTGSTGLEILLQSGATKDEALQYARRFGIEELMSRGCRLFSSGETRKAYTIRELLKKPDLLILDEPYEGLDEASQAECSSLIAELVRQGQAMLLLANRVQDIAPTCTHLALLRDGEIVANGPKLEILESPAARHLFKLDSQETPEIPPHPDPGYKSPDPLLRFRSAKVRFGEVYQFKDLDWTLRAGEHTLIAGPNGCGKSTLLSLISGDHPQCYCNDLLVLGYQRGSGETIWDIKRRIGHVSPALHRDYRVGADCQTVVVSGFYDSIGLYQTPTLAQLRNACSWLAFFGMSNATRIQFRALSYGQQRLVLIARALVKQPPLLLLDEPTQGLDDLNRHLVLACLERLATLRHTTMLFVSHRKDEHLPLFRHRLQFQLDPTPRARYQITIHQSSPSRSPRTCSSPS